MRERRGGEREFLRERVAQLARQVGHRGDVGDAAAVDPLENLARMKAWMAEAIERRLDAFAFEIGQVGRARWCGHGISLVSQRLAELRW